MASYSDCVAIQNKINAIQRENSALQNELRVLVNAISDANDSVRSAHVRVKSSITDNNNVLKSGDNTLNEAYKIEQEIEAINKRYKTMEVSYKAVRSLTNQIRYSEGNNRKVNRIVSAIIDNLSLGLVSDQSMEAVAEKVHLETKNFYLSYIMMSIILWRRGEQTAANRALEKALEINFKHSCIFYMLFNYKFGRYDAAAKWLEQILKEDITGADAGIVIFMMLAVMNDAASSVKNFSHRARQYIRRATGKELKAADPSLIRRISQKLYAVATSTSGEYAVIKKYAPDDYTNLKSALNFAISNRDIVSYFENLLKVSEGRNASDYVDKLFEAELKDMSTPETQKIEDEIRYHEAIIDAKGDVEQAVAAKAAADLEKMSHIVVNEVLFDLVYSTPEKFKGKELLSRFAYKNISYLHKEAYKRYRQGYHRLKPDSISYKIDTFAAKTNFSDPKAEESAIENHYQKAREQEYIESKKIRPIVLGSIMSALGIAAIILTIIQIIPSEFFFALYAGIALTALGALAIATRIIKNKRLYQTLTKKYEIIKQNTITEYHSLKADYKAYKEDFEEYDRVSEKIEEFFE